LHRETGDADLFRRLEAIVDLARRAPFKADLWRAQNRCYEMLQTAAASGVATTSAFRRVAGKLGVRVE